MINFIYGDHEIINGILNIIFCTALLIAIILFSIIVLPYVGKLIIVLSCPSNPIGWGCAVP